MTEHEWGPWVEHDGSGCPCVGRYVIVESKGCDCTQRVEMIAVDSPEWGEGIHADCIGCGKNDIMGQIGRYRIRKDKSVETMKAAAKALDCISPANLEGVE